MKNLLELEQLSFTVERIAATIWAVDDAIIFSPYSAKTYQGALYLAVTNLQDIAKKMQDIVEGETKARKASKEIAFAAK